MAEQSTSRLERLREKREQINARIQSIEARMKSSERKKDTRRKILVGAYYLDMAAKENKMDALTKIMKNYLTRDSDKELFDLNLLSDTKK
jgi:hypothetical protein